MEAQLPEQLDEGAHLASILGITIGIDIHTMRALGDVVEGLSGDVHGSVRLIERHGSRLWEGLPSCQLVGLIRFIFSNARLQLLPDLFSNPEQFEFDRGSHLIRFSCICNYS